MDIKNLFKSKWKDTVTFILIALILAIAVWLVFGKGAETTSSVSNSTTSAVSSEEEIKLAELLSQIQGVGEVDVMIYQTESGEKSVVVVCDGANNLQVNMDVREAAATALGTTQQAVKIYLKKD